MSFIPESTVIGQGERAVLVLHGILGSGRNWRSFCRRLAAVRPELRFILVDLRNHGESPPAPAPHGLEACADDLDRLGPAEIVIGHSFGGKVALAWARRQPAGLRRVILLDSWPGISRDAGSRQVLSVIDAVRGVEIPAPDRDSVRVALTARGLGPSLVAWLLTSTRRSEGGWIWKYDLDGIDAMIADYFGTDLWPWLQTRRGGPHVDVVAAERSERWTPQALARFEDLPDSSEVSVHVLENAGHWLHVDNPDGLIDLLCEILESH